MKVTIEKGTRYAELTDEQGVVVDTIHNMISELEDLLPTLKEVIDYDVYKCDGYCSTIECDPVALGNMLKQVKKLDARLRIAVKW